MKDNEESCATCRFSKEVNYKEIVCRKNPPTVIPSDTVGFLVRFPTLDPDCWCGAYEPKKIN